MHTINRLVVKPWTHPANGLACLLDSHTVYWTRNGGSESRSTSDVRQALLDRRLSGNSRHLRLLPSICRTLAKGLGSTASQRRPCRLSTVVRETASMGRSVEHRDTRPYVWPESSLEEIVDKFGNNSHIDAIPDQLVLGLRRNVFRPDELCFLVCLRRRQKCEQTQKLCRGKIAQL